MDFTLGLGQLIGAGINAWSENKVQKQQFENQKQLQNLAYQQQVGLIDKQNEYNTPSAQMARYKEAGLNPYAMLGGVTSGTQSSAGSVPSYPQVQGGASGKALAHLAEAFNMADLKMKSAQIKGQELANEGQELDNLKVKESMPDILEGIRLSVDKAKNEIKLQGQTYNINDLKYQGQEMLYEIERHLYENSIHPIQLQSEQLRLANEFKRRTWDTSINFLSQELDNSRQTYKNLQAQNDAIYKQMLVYDANILNLQISAKQKAIMLVVNKRIAEMTARKIELQGDLLKNDWDLATSLYDLNINNAFLRNDILRSQSSMLRFQDSSQEIDFLWDKATDLWNSRPNSYFNPYKPRFY